MSLRLLRWHCLGTMQSPNGRALVARKVTLLVQIYRVTWLPLAAYGTGCWITAVSVNVNVYRQLSQFNKG